jgi:APA family basic amino acid/polyamine antiporter
VITILHPTVAAAGVGWLLFGIAVFLWYRNRQGLDLTTTHKVAIPQPVVDHEAEYDSVLVALAAEDGYDAELVATAIKLAARRRHGIHVLVTISVPYSLPVKARMRDQEAGAQSLIEQARVQGGRRVTGHIEKVRAGQAGRRIIEEAEDMRATAIVMGLPKRVPGASLFGKTLETVLADRPCRVVIETSPALAAARGAYNTALRAEVAG